MTPVSYLVGLVLGDGGQLLGRLGVRCGGAGARGAGQCTAVDVPWTCVGARPGSENPGVPCWVTFRDTPSTRSPEEEDEEVVEAKGREGMRRRMACGAPADQRHAPHAGRERGQAGHLNGARCRGGLSSVATDSFTQAIPRR